MWVPVMFRFSRRKWTRSVRASTSTSCGTPLTVTWILCVRCPLLVVGAVATAMSLPSRGACDGFADRALREHADNVELVLGRTAQIRPRLRLSGGRGRRGGDRLVVGGLSAEGGLGLAGPDPRGPGV